MSRPGAAAGASGAALAGLRAEVRAFLREQGAAPHCHSWMLGFDAGFSRALGARGWIGMTWPAEYGGHGRTAGERLVVIEELLAAGAPVAAHWISDRQTGAALLRHGSEQQKRRYLPAIARGECYFAIGMSEPDSGSDLASVSSTARPAPAGWRVSGRKVWASHAHRAHFLLALVRTAPRDPQRRHDGLSQLIIDLSARGVTVRPIRSADGGAHFTEILLDDVAVPADALLGAEGSGWQQVTAELADERSGPERFLSTAPLLWALIRRAGGPDPAIGGLLAGLQTLRALSAGIADALERGESPAVQAAMVKDLGTRFEAEVIEVARQSVDSQPALDAPDELDRLLAEAIVHAPDATLRGGTTEVLRGIVAQDLVGR